MHLSIYQIIFNTFYSGIIFTKVGLLLKQVVCPNALKEFKEKNIPRTVPGKNRMANLNKALIKIQPPEHHSFCSANHSFNSILTFVGAEIWKNT